MKILQIIPYFYPAWAYGGTPRVVFNLCRELVKQGQDVIVYTTDTLDKNARTNKAVSCQLSVISHSKFYFDTEIDGMKVRYFRNISNRLAFAQKLFLTPGFASFLKDELRNTDIVHLQEYRTLQNASAWQGCKKKGMPYVLSAHGAILRIMGREKRKGLFDRLWGYNILRDAKKLIALTELEKRQYQQFGIDERKIEVVPNGIDLSQFASLPERGIFQARYGLQDYSIILSIGRIHRIKGIDILIEAFAEVKREMIDCKLIIAGPDDGFKRDCGMRIAECGLRQVDLSGGGEISSKEDVRKADVIFTGMVSGEEKLSFFVDADVTVLPSRFENFPSVPFESLMCGTPIVISNACGIAEMIKDTHAGYLAVVEDRTDLKEKILHVLKNHEEARASVEKGKRLVIEKLDWKHVAAQMLEIYEGCLQ